MLLILEIAAGIVLGCLCIAFLPELIKGVLWLSAVAIVLGAALVVWMLYPNVVKDTLVPWAAVLWFLGLGCWFLHKLYVRVRAFVRGVIDGYTGKSGSEAKRSRSSRNLGKPAGQPPA